MKKWMLQRIPAQFNELSAIFHLDPVVIRVLANRGYDTEEKIREFLNTEDALYDRVEGLPDLDKAIQALKGFKEEGKKVRIIGDYDIDGVCATAILLKAFREYGLEADFVIPHRVQDGYGLNKQLIENAHEEGIDAIITCDNGISAYEAVEVANSYGMPVVITDHHEIPEVLPNAVAIVDPKRMENTYPNPEICGAYVAYKVISKLLWDGKDEGSFLEREQNLKHELMMLAGFATVGDVMPLSSENRGLVRFCLAHLKDGLNPGMDALIDETALRDKTLSSFSIGFVLGPCINATGRLDSAANALNLLMADNPEEAKELAGTLHNMNEERKELTASGVDAAVQIVENMEELDSVLVIQLEDVHESIVGIIAGRIKEMYYRPTIVFARTEEGFLKGSGRSIEGYDMFAKLSECKDLLLKFGGHPMAAGVSIEPDKLEEFREFLNFHANLSEDDLIQTLKIDADMPFSYVTEELIHDLSVLEPFGARNEKPNFARRDVTIVDGKLVGANHDVGIYTIKEASSGDRTFKLKLFRGVSEFHAYLDEKNGPGTADGIYQRRPVSLKVAYYPDLNEFRGETNIEFVMTDYQ